MSWLNLFNIRDSNRLLKALR